MLTLLSTARRLRRAEALLGPEPPAIADGSDWDWFAEGCPCGLPAGECTIHPGARAAPRPPGGDWRTWLLPGGRAPDRSRSPGAGGARPGAGDDARAVAPRPAARPTARSARPARPDPANR
jgi:hypothetical protein